MSGNAQSILEVAVAVPGGRRTMADSLEAFFAFGEAAVTVMEARSVAARGTDRARSDLDELDAAHARLQARFAVANEGVYELALIVIARANAVIDQCG